MHFSLNKFGYEVEILNTNKMRICVVKKGILIFLFFFLKCKSAERKELVKFEGKGTEKND